MTAYFPDPYPDELFYSICARYSDRMKYPKKNSIFIDLMGGGHKRISKILPNMHQFTTQPQIFDQQFIQQMLIEHTIFPYYYPFFQKDKYEKANKSFFGNIYKDDEAIHWERVLLFNHNYNRRMRYCPICTIEDKKYFSEIYWHRIHQIYGVEICPKHNIILVNSAVSFFDDNPRLYSAENVIKKNLVSIIKIVIRNY